MTVETVSIIITIKAGKKSKGFAKHLEPQYLEKGGASLGQELSGKVFELVLEVLDDCLQGMVPSSWKNVGRERRRMVFEHGYTVYRRRIYKDEKGNRRKPLDELLNIRRYERNSQNVQELGSALAAKSTFREAADLISFLLKTEISPSSVHRMVKRMGKRILAQEKEPVSRPPGTIPAPVLNGEADGVWIHLQRERKKKAEVKVGMMYTGKIPIGKGRFRCENKVTMTQLGGSTREWQLKMCLEADQTYDLTTTQMVAVGGDGSPWVMHSFDNLLLPQIRKLDPFHVSRAVHQAFGSYLDCSVLLKTLNAEGLEAVITDLHACIQKAHGKRREQMKKTYKYLWNNREALTNLDRRGLPDLPFCTLGAIEGNVDKLVRQRMEGRGFCWTIEGAQMMLAVLRHKDELLAHSFCYVPIGEKKKPVNRVKIPKDRPTYEPVSGSLPIFLGPDQSQPWVKLLRTKLNAGLSINAFL
jgi:hypothetical protein